LAAVERRIRAALLAATVAAASAAGAAEPAALLETFQRGHVVIETGHECIFLDVWLPEGASQRQQGLMFVRQLGEFEGMYFLTAQPAEVRMWMRNTYVPLDMLFVGENGQIAGIAAQTVPLSEQLMPSPGPVTGVLEVNAGFAARHDVAPGDAVRLVR
jgi:uncharacterized membrane protein (UPF0127 family)